MTHIKFASEKAERSIKGSEIRRSNQNSWPAKEHFDCEIEFSERLSKFGSGQIFLTAPLSLTDDNFTNKFIAGILDGLDGFPARPELAFDQFYRCIDVGTSRGGLEKLIEDLKKKNENTWRMVFGHLTTVAPRQTGEYIARRILECQTRKTTVHERNLLERAARSFEQHRFDAIKQKYLTAPAASTQFHTLKENNSIYDCGGLIYLMLRQDKSLKRNPIGGVLDLSDQNNVLPWDRKLQILIKSCLTTYRHERAHGVAFSPFKSTKASMKTYAHAYYCAIVAYATVLALISVHLDGVIEDSEAIRWAEQVAKKFQDFFGEDLKK